MATPTLVQDAAFNYTSAPANTTDRRYPFANTVLSGNAVIVCIQCSDTETPVITDDGAASPNYTILVTGHDTTNGQFAIMAYRLNCTNSPKVIKVTFGTARGQMSCYISEWYNISTSSTNFKSNSNFGSSTTPTPGTATPNATNDLILSYCVVSSKDPWASGNTDPLLTSWTAPTSPAMSLYAADIWAGQAAAVTIAPNTSAENPNWTLSPSRGWCCIQGVFSNATQGTAPSASPRVISVTHQMLALNQGSSTSPYNIQWPTGKGGDFVYAGYIGVGGAITPNHLVTDLTDSVNGAWTPTGALYGTDSGTAGACRGYYFSNPSLSSTMTMTLAFSDLSGSIGDNLFLYECVGPDNVAPLDQHQTIAGNNASSLNFDLTDGSHTVSITPARPGGLIFVTVGSADATSGTPNCLTGISPGTFLTSTDPSQEVLSWENDNNNLWAVYQNPTTASITFNVTCGVAGSLDWRAIIDAFIPPPTPVILRQNYRRRRQRFTAECLD